MREHPARHPMAGAGVAHPLPSDLAQELGLLERAGEGRRVRVPVAPAGEALGVLARKALGVGVMVEEYRCNIFPI